MCFADSSASGNVTPVTFPPGRARLATRPSSSALGTSNMTTGTVADARFAARTAATPIATTTSTLRRTSCVASVGSCSSVSPMPLGSSATFWPSTYPAARSVFTNVDMYASNGGAGQAPTHSSPIVATGATGCATAGVPPPRTPTTSAQPTLRPVTPPPRFGGGTPRRDLPGDRVELGGVDRPEADVVAGTKQDRRGRAGIVEAQRGPAQQPEAAGALHRVDGGLRPADRDAPGGRLGPGPVEPRDRQPRGLPRHVREARREADEVDVVLRPRMERHDLRGSEAEAAGDLLEIRTVLPAVRAGQLHPAPRRRRRVRQPARQLEELSAQGRPREHQRVVVDEERPERGDRVDQARQPGREEQPFQRQRARVRLAGDLVVELDRDRAVSRREQTRRGV